jgi:hypothetical protein
MTVVLGTLGNNLALEVIVGTFPVKFDETGDSATVIAHMIAHHLWRNLSS